MIKNIIESINLENLAHRIPEAEHRGYFLDVAGAEHYRLLAAYSTLFENQILLDIGTFKGCSALALSYNPRNKVISFDIQDRVNVQKPDNVDFIVGDVLEKKYQPVIMAAPIIMLDTFHDGTFERQFLAHLRALNWHGTLLMDDIYLNDVMREVWREIKERKEDISRLGHWTGTGSVAF